MQNTWENLYTKKVETEFTVKEVLYANTYGGELLVELHTVNGVEVDACAILRGEVQLPFYIEDRVRASLTVHELDYEAFSESTVYNYLSQGAQAILVLEEDASVALVSSGTNAVLTRLLDLRAVLAHRIALAISGEEGNVSAAMLLGSKELISDQTARNFKYSGVSHLLALSGLHLVILAGLVDRLLYLLGAGKRLRIAIIFPLCVFYLMLTGCNYSLLRAMIMLGFVYLSALLREDNDPLTTLLLAGTVILLFTPYAVFSISFQMTMLATFGILAFLRIQTLFGKLFPRGRGRFSRFGWRILRFACSSVLLSISTTVSLLPVLWLEIGSYSLMTPISNLILVPLAPFILFGAVLVLILPFPFVGGIVSLPARLAIFLTEELGSVQAMVSLTESYIPFIVVPVILATVVLLVIDLKRFYAFSILPAALCMMCFVLIFTVFTAMDQSLSVVYRQDGKNEGLLMVRGSQAVICDLSNTSLTQLRADWRAAQQQGATELSVLLLTHYHSKSTTALSRLSKSVYLHKLWLPTPTDESERAVCAELIALAIEREIEVTLYDTEMELTIFECGTVRISDRFYHSRSTEPAFSLSIAYGNDTLCYHTASHYEYLAAQGIEHVCTATHLILGAHGPVPKKESDLSRVYAQSVVIGNGEQLPLFKLPEALVPVIAPGAYCYELES